jgi:hypothetical protein
VRSVQNFTPKSSTPLLETRGQDCATMPRSSSKDKGTNSTARLMRSTYKLINNCDSPLHNSSENSDKRTACTIGASLRGALERAAGRTQRVAMNLKELRGGWKGEQCLLKGGGRGLGLSLCNMEQYGRCWQHCDCVCANCVSLVRRSMLKILSGQFPLLEKRNERRQNLQQHARRSK